MNINNMHMKGDNYMIKSGDIVTYWDKNEDCYYMGVVMETNENITIVQGFDNKPFEVATSRVKYADKYDMADELRCIYGFYH